MKMLGLMRVKDEDRWLRRVLESIYFCDHVIVLDDNSTDETPRICREFGVEYYKKPYDAGWEEGIDRETLAVMASAYKPEWICSPDGDEVFMDDTLDRIRKVIDDPQVNVIDVLNLNLWGSEHIVRIDAPWGDQYRQRFWRFKAGKLTYTKDHCSIPNEITERPFARVGVKMLHFGNLTAMDRMRRYLRYQATGNDWPTLIQGDACGPSAEGMIFTTVEEICAKS